MTNPRSVRHALPASLAGLGLAALLTGCGTYTGEEPGKVAASASESPSASESATESASETTTPEPSASTSPATPSSSASPEGPEGMLLNAEEMPGLNELTTWTEESTEEQGLEADGSSAVGVCQLTPLHDIGATEAIQRTFSADGASATQVIATLADAKSVRQTRQVLISWHDKCDAEVTPVEEVEVPTGTAEAYVANHPADSADEQTFESVAINVSGNHISLVVIESQGQDYNYEDGQTPAVLAAKAVATKLS